VELGLRTQCVLVHARGEVGRPLPVRRDQCSLPACLPPQAAAHRSASAPLPGVPRAQEAEEDALMSGMSAEERKKHKLKRKKVRPHGTAGWCGHEAAVLPACPVLVKGGEGGCQGACVAGPWTEWGVGCRDACRT